MKIVTLKGKADPGPKVPAKVPLGITRVRTSPVPLPPLGLTAPPSQLTVAVALLLPPLADSSITSMVRVAPRKPATVVPT